MSGTTFQSFNSFSSLFTLLFTLLVYCIYMNICLYKTITCIFMQPKMESYSSGFKLGKPNIKYEICRLLNWSTLLLRCLNFHNYDCFRTLNILNFPGFSPQVIMPNITVIVSFTKDPSESHRLPYLQITISHRPFISKKNIS